MEKYDYVKSVCDDINDWLLERYTINDLIAGDIDRDNIIEELQDCDSITGNLTGSYYCNTWKAEEALCHNRPLLEAACGEFGDQSIMARDPEAQDVIIRFFLVPYCYDALMQGYETNTPTDYYGIELQLGV